MPERRRWGECFPPDPEQGRFCPAISGYELETVVNSVWVEVRCAYKSGEPGGTKTVVPPLPL